MSAGRLGAWSSCSTGTETIKALKNAKKNHPGVQIADDVIAQEIILLAFSNTEDDEDEEILTSGEALADEE